MSPIYLGSILLEPNRWTKDKKPSYRVSDWVERIRAAGMDGIELWENHYRLASSEEGATLRASAGFFPVFNSYAPFDGSPASARLRAEATKAVGELKSAKVKFNVGGDTGAKEEYLRVAREWAEGLPSGVRALCECHPGTVVETPESAAEAFRTWDKPNFEAIVHAFSVLPATLAQWFKLLGPRITHVHVQTLGADGKRARLDRNPTKAKDALRILKDFGFSGSFTLEFTEGTGTPDDKPEFLFENARADLAFLRENGF